MAGPGNTNTSAASTIFELTYSRQAAAGCHSPSCLLLCRTQRGLLCCRGRGTARPLFSVSHPGWIKFFDQYTQHGLPCCCSQGTVGLLPSVPNARLPRGRSCVSIACGAGRQQAGTCCVTCSTVHTDTPCGTRLLVCGEARPHAGAWPPQRSILSARSSKERQRAISSRRKRV